MLSKAAAPRRDNDTNLVERFVVREQPGAVPFTHPCITAFAMTTLC